MLERDGSLPSMGTQERFEVRSKPFDEPPIPMNGPVDERAPRHGLDRASELTNVARCKLADRDGLSQEDLVAVERALRSREGKGVERGIAQIDLEKRQNDWQALREIRRAWPYRWRPAGARQEASPQRHERRRSIRQSTLRHARPALAGGLVSSRTAGAGWPATNRPPAPPRSASVVQARPAKSRESSPRESQRR